MKKGTRGSKVLVLTPVFPPCPQAPAQRISSFVKALIKSRFEVLVLTCSRGSNDVREFSDYDDTLVYDFHYPMFLFASSFVIPSPIVLLLYLFASVIILARKRFDVILASVPAGETAVIGFVLSRVFKIPLLVDIRDMFPPPTDGIVRAHMGIPSKLNDLFSGIFRIFYQNADKLVCVDMSIKRRLVTSGVDVRRVVVIPHGAESSVYKPCRLEDCNRIRSKYELPLEKFIFVYAGALAWYYPVIEVARGLKKILCTSARNDLELLILSHLDYGYEKKIIEKLGLEDSVRFMGPLTVADAAEVLSACDVGLVVYRGEDYWKGMYGSKIFSYMSCKLPILASGPYGSVIDRLIQEHKTGFFVGPPYESNFAKGISFFLNNRNEVKIMGENAREVVKRLYDKKRLGLRFVSLIDELCKRNGL